MNNDSVLFAYSRVKYHESKLIGAERFSRILEAKTCEDAFKVLLETSYSESAATDECAKFAFVTGAERQKLFNFFGETCPDENVKACFLKPYDYHNAKVLIKAKYSDDNDYEGLTENLGTIDINGLKDAIFNEKYSYLPEFMEKTLISIDVSRASYGNNPRLWSTELDKALFADITAHAKRTRHTKVKDYFILKIDTENLLTSVKCKILGLNTSYFQQQFIPDGRTEQSRFIASINAANDIAAEPFKYTDLYNIAKEGYANLQKGGITYFERAAQNILNGYFYPFRDEIETVYPILNYFIKKSAEIKNINLIFAAQNGGANKNEIKDRIVSL